jgi:L-rhamnonate dehydratase
MRITDVSGYALSSPIDPPQDRRFHGGVRRLLKRDVVLVVVESSDGAHGVATAGASSSAMREYFAGDSQETFADIVDGTVADALEGESVDTVADAHAHLRETNLPDRLLHEAISAVDVALYDLRGKEVGAPIYELLATEYGTEPTREMPLYASAGMYMEPEEYAEQAETLCDLGFFGYKYRPGIGPESDRRTIELVTEAAGEMAVMLDVHTWWKIRDGYDRETVRELVKFAHDRNCFWVEEPVSPDDHAGYVELAETGAPLAGGESEPTPDRLVDLGETDAVNFLQGDVRHHCGYTGCRPAVEFCNNRETEFVPHNFGTWVGLLANAHLVAAAPDVSLLEYPVFEDDPVLDADTDPGMYPFNLAFDIIEGEPAVEDGALTVSDDPGLGVDVDFDVLDDYPFRDGPWTEFHYDDG